MNSNCSKTQKENLSVLRSRLRHQIAAQEMPPYVYAYPTKRAYRPYSHPWQEAAKSWLGFAGKMTLYIHIPFCEMKCAFCDLFTVTNLHRNFLIERYVQCILKEIELMMPFLNTNRIAISSLYFGGGTPTLLSHDHLESILNKIQASFTLDNDAEISIEGAPNTLSPAKCAEYKELGFNRLSIGAQTFVKSGLKEMGRLYGAELGYKMAHTAVRSGIPNVNIDLIYGLPGQTLGDWRYNLECAREIGSQTVTAYPLALRNRTRFEKVFAKNSRNDFIDEKTAYEWYEFTVNALAAAGYEAKTLVTYAKSAGGCRHEQNEYVGMPTLAFGAGARKYAPTLHYVDEDYTNRRPNQAMLASYMDSIEKGAVPIQSAVALSKEERQRRFVILGLLSSGIRIKHYAELFQEEITQPYRSYFDVLESEDLLVQNDAQVMLTPKGKKYSSIIGNLLAREEETCLGT